MDSKGKASFSELKVGIFVVAACTILAIAIFTIGTQVGLLEDTFAAKTYLNTVSGLKPGDVVLLGGVEVGNVTSVNITRQGELPETPTNEVNTRLITEATQQIQQLQGQSDKLRQDLLKLRVDYNKAVAEFGEEATRTERLKARVNRTEDQANGADREIANLLDDIEDARADRIGSAPEQLVAVTRQAMAQDMAKAAELFE